MCYEHSAFLELPAPVPMVARHLSMNHGADLFLSGAGYSGETENHVCLDCAEELFVYADTTPQELADFAFSLPGPTFGYLAYEYGHVLRGVHTTHAHGQLGHLKKYRTLIQCAGDGPWSVRSRDKAGLDQVLDKVRGMLAALDSKKIILPAPTGELVQSLDRSAYETRVLKTLEHIKDGDIYQLNLSVRFARTFPWYDAAELFRRFYTTYPAPYYALFHSAPYEILSTSPECFLRVDNGRVLSRPIKGTACYEGPHTAGELTASAKEDAELSMIVDLIRNDVSSHCAYGSVRVENHKSTFTVDNLVQMYSNVRGKLREDSTCLDLFLDAFPGGSITGCPKKRAMEIITTLEPHSRGVYCGSFFIIKDERNMNSSIGIRTGTYNSNTRTLEYYAGSGIVADSDPAKEYDETLAKAQKFLQL